MKIKSYKALYFIIALMMSIPALALEEETPQQTIDYLKTLNFEQLLDVEVFLDDVFDVFDGLVHRRKVTVASGIEQSTARAPGVTTVITAQDIEATGSHELDDILATVPGLHVSWDNFYNPIYTFRSIYSLTNPEVLMLVNGIPLRDLTAGNRGMAWGGWPVNNIARIEIIRGPGSAVYGADAFSGVINIITKQASDIKGTETGMRVGSHDDFNVWALHGGHWGDFNIAVAVEIQDSNGADNIIDADRQSLLDRATGTRASQAPGVVQRGRQRLDAQLDASLAHWRLRAGFQARDHLGVGAGAARALDPDGYLSEERYHLNLTYHNPTLTEHWDVQMQVSLLDRQFASHHINLFPAGVRLPFPQRPQGVVYDEGVWQSHRLDQRYSRFNLEALFKGWSGHLLRWGAGYAYEDLYHTTYTTNRGLSGDLKPIPPEAGAVVLDDTPAVIVPENARQNIHAFVQDTWALDDGWELTLGVRYDDYSDFGHTVNPRAALVWQVNPKLTSKLLYGQAFRAPAYRELYARNNLFQGNNDLQPETIETWELAFDWSTNQRLHLMANTFYFDVKDKILFVPQAADNLLHAMNQGSQQGYGFELEARWKMSARSSVLFNYAYARSQQENADSYQDIGNYPRQTAYLRTDYLLHTHWYLNTQMHWVADRQRPPRDTRLKLADYTRVDLTLRYKDIHADTWNVAFGVRNVFDSDQREPMNTDIPDDLPLPARHLFAELRYRF